MVVNPAIDKFPYNGEKIRRVNRVRKHSGYICGHGLSPEKRDERFSGMAELDKKPARTLREAAAVIEEVCGLKRSLPQGKKFLKNDFKPLKTGFLPAKADGAKQKAFAEDKLKPQITPAKV
jgi:hypothetical protein